MRRTFELGGAVVLAVFGVPGILSAQYAMPPQAPVLPAPLHVRLAGPPGMRVSVYRGAAPPRTFSAPTQLAFRPGYRFRVQLDGFNDRPGAVLFPSFEVIGSLRLPHGMRASEHPVTVVFSDEDFASVQAGNVVTKLVILERPETAIPIATKTDLPIELNVLPNGDLFKEAQLRGRPLMIVRLGQREMTPAELADESVPGTVLLPGESVLPPPRDPPCLPWMCYPLIDPVAGQSCPEDEICFHDGGDTGQRAGIAPDGKLVGLDPSDTIAQYRDSFGTPQIAISNCVCFCVPRYLVLRTEFTTATNTVPVGPGFTALAKRPILAQLNLGPLERVHEIMPGGIFNTIRPSGVFGVQQVSVVGKVEGLEVRTQVEFTGKITGSCLPPELELTEKPLCIIKWPDKCDPQLGEIVTFFIRYSNQGHKVITGIVVNDSLTARLEYVAGSARSDRDALFTLTPNEADSAILRWEITQPLMPGQSGTVTFQARVR